MAVEEWVTGKERHLLAMHAKQSDQSVSRY